jgi:hypothetical protein
MTDYAQIMVINPDITKISKTKACNLIHIPGASWNSTSTSTGYFSLIRNIDPLPLVYYVY